MHKQNLSRGSDSRCALVHVSSYIQDILSCEEAVYFHYSTGRINVIDVVDSNQNVLCLLPPTRNVLKGNQQS